MSKLRIYSRNIMASWAGYGANLVVMFFLSPFVIHSLGDAAYGVWALMMGVTGYLGLVDLGVRGSTGRFINYHVGRDDPEKVNRFVNTSMFFFTLVSLVVIGVSAVVGMLFGRIFPKIPPNLASQAKWALLLLGANVWLGFFSALFNQLLCSRNRFDLCTAVNVVVLAVRAAGTLWVLGYGWGLVALAMVQFCSGAVGCILMYCLARWKGQAVRLHRRFVDRRTFRELFGFSLWATVGHISIKLIYYTDVAVIALLLGARHITVYCIGFMLIEYGRQAVAHVVHVLSPDIHKAAGRNDLAALRRAIVSGARATMLPAVPLFVGFVFLGREFIGLWMGPQYAESALILLLLTIPQFGAAATRVCGAALGGLGHVRFLAYTAIAEALCNLGASVLFVLALGWGLHGVALGTVIPMILFNNILQPAYTCRKVGMAIGAFTRATALRWLVGVAVLAGAVWVFCAWIPMGGWGNFCAKVGLLLLAYAPIGVLCILGPDEREWISRLVCRRRLLHRPVSSASG